MRMSDWSSDVCSSDLGRGRTARGHADLQIAEAAVRARELAVIRDVKAADARVSTARQRVDRHRHELRLGCASCRERVCKFVYISLVAASLKRQTASSRGEQCRENEQNDRK